MVITPKIIYSYWFIIIFFFWFILKKILNISKCYICNSYFSLKRFLISLIAVSPYSFFSLKRFLIYFKISIKCKKVQLILDFSTMPCIFYIASRFGRRHQLIFRQFVNLINHNTIEWYSTWNTSNRMLIEEKAKETNQCWCHHKT